MTLFIENSQYVRLSTLEKHSDHTVEEWLSSWQYIEVKRELFDHPCYPKVQVIIVVDIDDLMIKENEIGLAAYKYQCPQCKSYNYTLSFIDPSGAMENCNQCNAELQF